MPSIITLNECRETIVTNWERLKVKSNNSWKYEHFHWVIGSLNIILADVNKKMKIFELENYPTKETSQSPILIIIQ